MDIILTYADVLSEEHFNQPVIFNTGLYRWPATKKQLTFHNLFFSKQYSNAAESKHLLICD